MAKTEVRLNDDPAGLIRAIVADLDRLIQTGDFPAGRTPGRKVPAVVRANQLSLFGLLALKAAGKSAGLDLSHQTKLEGLMERVANKSEDVWAAAFKEGAGSNRGVLARQRMLANVEPLRPTVRALVQYAGQHIGMTFGRLSDYGVDDLQATLASLIGRISQLANAKLVPGRAGTVPSAVKASLGLGIVAGGLARRRRLTAEEVLAARALSNLGAQKDQPGESESKSLKRLRGRLRKLQAQLPEQRT